MGLFDFLTSQQPLPPSLPPTWSFLLAGSTIHDTRLHVGHRQLPLQHARLLLVPQLRGGAHSLQPLPTTAGAVHPQRVGSAQTLPAFLTMRGHLLRDNDRRPDVRCSVVDDESHLLAVWTLVLRGGPTRPLSLRGALRWDLGISHQSFSAQVWCRVVCGFPQADLDVVVARGQQLTQDLWRTPVCLQPPLKS